MYARRLNVAISVTISNEFWDNIVRAADINFNVLVSDTASNSGNEGKQ